MVIFESVLVDTDIPIKAFRGEKTKQESLKYLKDKYCISVITACELINGAKNNNQRIEFLKLVRTYQVAFIDEKISEQAFSLFKRYSSQNDMKISDSFIAATAIVHDLLLYTDNKKDFNFIEGIKFYKEK
ncbi:MAG: type II toxin-antitoxin system VapC family toxin [Ginsengibacter sp.]